VGSSSSDGGPIAPFRARRFGSTRPSQVNRPPQVNKRGQVNRLSRVADPSQARDVEH
jgi:hypothetical protein